MSAISNFCSQAQKEFVSYVEKIPTELSKRTAQSFVMTAALNCVATTFSSAMFGGAVAATATLIEAATRPAIMALFSECPLVARAVQFVAPLYISLAVAAVLAPWLGVTFKASYVVLPIILRLLFNEFSAKSDFQTLFRNNRAMIFVA